MPRIVCRDRGVSLCPFGTVFPTPSGQVQRDMQLLIKKGTPDLAPWAAGPKDPPLALGAWSESANLLRRRSRVSASIARNVTA
jgi:hypothetical protein